MAGGLTVSVRQIASYPLAIPTAADLVLVQSAGLGGPYSSIAVGTLVSQGLSAGPALGVGTVPPADATGNQIFAYLLAQPLEGGSYWNLYTSTSQGTQYRYQATGPAASFGYDNFGFFWQQAPWGEAGANLTGFNALMSLSPAGGLALPFGTLTVARDPSGALEVATMGWVGANTVASFNGRRGVVQLTANDVYAALCLDPCDPFITVSQTNAAICAAIQQLLIAYPGVSSVNGRFGNVFINSCDLNIATFSGPASGLPPLMAPTPPQPTALPAPDPTTVVNIEWVEAYITALTTTGDFATKAYVNAAVAASVTSFNGRSGAVLLALSDITAVGGAPTASPIFSGVPTAPTAALGSSTSQLATTAFVMNAVSEATAGVASFNGRTGAVVLNSTDITNAGGAPLLSPAFGGSPTAPTPPAGNSSPLIATTAFVAAAIAGFSGVTSFNTRTGAVTLASGDITGAGGALLASPAFSGTPTAPTASAGTDNTQVATTAFVNAAIAGLGPGVTSFEGRTGAVTLQANDIQAAGGLVNPSVALTGTPTAPTPVAGNSSTQIATTAFVGAAILANSVTSFNTRTGAVTLQGSDITGAGGALLASPSFTGVPTAPTAAPATNTTQLATTAFVTAALTTQAANSVTSFNGRQGIVTLTTADITGAGGAPIANPNFSGTPTVPTATAGTSTTQAASTAFVMNAIAASTAGVTSFNSRTGAVTLQSNDLSAVGGALLASPTFTGTPTAPTPTAGDSSTNIATTAYVQSALSTAAVQSFNGRTGIVTLTLGDVTGVGGAPLASPAFSGTPSAPTAAAGTNTQQLATTAFVHGYLPLTGGQLSGSLGVGLAAPGTAVNCAAAIFTVPGSYMLNLAPGTPNTYWQTGTAGVIQQQPAGLNFATWASGAAGATPGTPGTMLLNPAGTLSGTTTAFSGGGIYGAAGIYGIGQLPGALVAQNNLSFGLVAYSNAGAGFAAQVVRVDTTATTLTQFFLSTTQVGSIVTNGSGVTYNTTSDDRLKTNQEAIADAGSLVDQLAPISFNWVNNPTLTDYGFSAQATEAVFPAAVTEGSTDKNPGDEGFMPWGMDYSKLVPLLVAAVRSLRARVAALEANANLTPAVPVAA